MAAGALELLAAAQFVDDREDVDAHSSVVQRHHGCEERGVGVVEEVSRLEPKPGEQLASREKHRA